MITRKHMYRENAKALHLIKSIRKFHETFNNMIPDEESWPGQPVSFLMGNVLKPLRLR